MFAGKFPSRGLRAARSVCTISDPKQIFARNLKELRISAGLSQEELASRAGLHRTYVSSVERGQRNVSLENIFALARALGTTPGVLVQLPEDDST